MRMRVSFGAHKRYEFGVKTSIAVTNKSNFVVGGKALPGNPYDGHSLPEALQQVRRLTGCAMEKCLSTGVTGVMQRNRRRCTSRVKSEGLALVGRSTRYAGVRQLSW